MSRTHSLTWSSALDLFKTYLRARRASPRTLKGYLADVGFLGDRLADCAPSEVQPEALRELQCDLLTGLASRSGRPLKARTVSAMTSAWKSFFKFLAEDGVIELDPTARLEHPRVPRQPPGNVLTVKEVARLLNAADCNGPLGLRDRAVVDLLFSTGLRNAEVLALNLADIDHEEREVIVQAGKGERGRIVPLTRSSYLRLAEFLDDGRRSLQTSHADSLVALFLSCRGRRINAQYLLRLFRRLRREAGIKKNVTPHTMRRTFATTLLKNGVSIRHIQVLLGHDDLGTTARYLSLDRNELRRELLLKHPRERFEA